VLAPGQSKNVVKQDKSLETSGQGSSQKLGYVDDISFRELFGRIRVFVCFVCFLLQIKICLFLAQGICI
jgi:hypothetical protein